MIARSNVIRLAACCLALPFSSAMALPPAQSSCSAPTAGNFSVGFNDTTRQSCATFSSATAQGLFDQLSQSGLTTILPSYQPTDVGTMTVLWNGLPITLAFPNSGTTLTFNIAALGVNQTFTGTTRDDSKQQFVDYIKKNPDLLNKITQYLASNSATSPISGQGGAIPTMVASDFNQNFTGSATNIAGPKAQGAPSNGLVGFGAQYASINTSANGVDSKVKATTIPLSYTIRNDADPRRQLTISLPITQIDTNGAKSYTGGLGLAYRVPMNDNWSLTPSGRYSVVGSADMASVAVLANVGLTSTYVWNLDSFDLAMGNMAGYVKSMKFTAGDYSFDPGITSTVLRNGLMLSQPVNLGGKMSLEYSLIDTRYVGGTKFYADNSQEVGITIGTNRNASSARSFLRAGLTYMRAQSTRGMQANMGYWF